MADVTIIELPVGALSPADDFRLDDDVEALAEMAKSIVEYGVLQPLTVCQVGDGWQVVAGRRRLAAARIAGLSVVPCIAKTLTADEAADIALTENIHRRDLSAVEEGLAFARLRDQSRDIGHLAAVDLVAQSCRRSARPSTPEVHSVCVGSPTGEAQGLTQTQIAKRVGRSQTSAGSSRTRSSSDTWFVSTCGAANGSAPRAHLSALVSHWRRRHDRLLAGLYAIQKSRTSDLDECLRMIDRLMKLDTQPFPEAAAS